MQRLQCAEWTHRGMGGRARQGSRWGISGYLGV